MYCPYRIHHTFTLIFVFILIESTRSRPKMISILNGMCQVVSCYLCCYWTEPSNTILSVGSVWYVKLKCSNINTNENFGSSHFTSVAARHCFTMVLFLVFTDDVRKLFFSMIGLKQLNRRRVRIHCIELQHNPAINSLLLRQQVHNSHSLRPSWTF